MARRRGAKSDSDRGSASSGRRSARITPSGTKRILAVGRVLAPVLAPLALKGAASAREKWEQNRAKRLGVSVEELPRYTGRGAALHVRLAGLATSVAGLRARHPEHTAFADDAERRLTDLTAAVRAAEQMPASRRRAAHRAVSVQLDDLEPDLLNRLGVPATQP